MNSNKKRLLIIGPLPNEKYNCQWGGATVLMKNFHDYLLQKGIGHCFVQTNRYVNPRTLQLRPWANKISFIFHFAVSLPFSESVMFNFSDHGTVNMFPILSRMAHRMGKKVILRKFGGSFDIYLQGISEDKKHRVLNALKEADMIFFETKASIAHLKTLIGETDKTHWFPNVRKATPHRKNPEQWSQKLVFISHVSNEKGMGVLLEAFRLLPNSYELDVYGAIKEQCYESLDWTTNRIKYMGEISSDEVLRKLTEYQLLLLPSYREGYPGIIIEALSVGMPVISTRVGGISEIIEDGFNGKLVKSHKAKDIADAILSFNETNYAYFCKNAFESFCDHFESDKTNEHIISLILS